MTGQRPFFLIEKFLDCTSETIKQDRFREYKNIFARKKRPSFSCSVSDVQFGNALLEKNGPCSFSQICPMSQKICPMSRKIGAEPSQKQTTVFLIQPEIGQ
jgi:hypothetical protein